MPYFEDLSPRERDLRATIRGFLLTATKDELSREIVLSYQRGDHFRATVIQELYNETS